MEFFTCFETHGIISPLSSTTVKTLLTKRSSFTHCGDDCNFSMSFLVSNSRLTFFIFNPGKNKIKCLSVHLLYVFPSNQIFYRQRIAEKCLQKEKQNILKYLKISIDKVLQMYYNIDEGKQKGGDEIDKHNANK